jgi:hypothetical protein
MKFRQGLNLILSLAFEKPPALVVVGGVFSLFSCPILRLYLGARR